MKCGNCNANATDADYLCVHCRRAIESQQDWDERKRVQRSVAEYVNTREKLYYGVEFMFPEDSPWAWVRIYDDPGLASPDNLENLGSGPILNAYVERLKMPMLVVWKSTGHIYNIDHDGAVPDDPIFVYKGDD